MKGDQRPRLPPPVAPRGSPCDSLSDLLVDSVAWNQNGDFTLTDRRLTTEARGWRQSRRFIKEIVFLFGVLRQMLHPAFDNDVTRRASAIAATGVFKKEVVTEHHVKDRARSAVVLKWGLGGIELNDVFRFSRFIADT